MSHHAFAAKVLRHQCAQIVRLVQKTYNHKYFRLKGAHVFREAPGQRFSHHSGSSINAMILWFVLRERIEICTIYVHSYITYMSSQAGKGCLFLLPGLVLFGFWEYMLTNMSTPYITWKWCRMFIQISYTLYLGIHYVVRWCRVLIHINMITMYNVLYVLYVLCIITYTYRILYY